MGMRVPPEPTGPLALSLVVANERESAALPKMLVLAPAQHQALEQTIQARSQLQQALEVARTAGHRASASLSQANLSMAQSLPRLEKLKAQAETLRQAQVSQSDAQQMRRLRRLRAELSVQIEDLQRVFDDHQQQALSTRSALIASQSEQLHLLDRLRAQDASLVVLQAHQPKMGETFRRLELALGQAHADLFLATLEGPAAVRRAVPMWRNTLLDVSEGVFEAHDSMMQGRQPEHAITAYVGGRAWLAAEVVWGFIVLGDLTGARLAFGRMCGHAAFLHPIDAIFRVFSAGYLLLGEAQLDELVEVLSLYRFEQTARGALAQTIWAMLDEDALAFGRSLKRLGRSEWETAWQGGRASLGLVSCSGLALARLARRHGLPVATKVTPQICTDVLWALDETSGAS